MSRTRYIPRTRPARPASLPVWTRTLLQWLWALAALPALANDPAPQLDNLTLLEIQQAAVDLVNLSTSPGIETSYMDIDNDGRSARLLRSNAGFGAEKALRDLPLSIYYGANLGGSYLEERFGLGTDPLQPASLDVDRSVVSVQVSAGLVMHFDRHFKLRTYLTPSYARLDDESTIEPQSAAARKQDELPEALESWNADAISGYGTVEGIYDRWYGQKRVEISGLYNLGYTDINSRADRRFDGSSWTSTGIARARLSGQTRFMTEGRPWRWVTYLHHTRFLGQDKASLGFRYYSELGAGMSWDWNIKPLDWFGLRSVGFGAGIIFGDDVTGATMGFSFK